jgi:hypothetical protein
VGTTPGGSAIGNSISSNNSSSNNSSSDGTMGSIRLYRYQDEPDKSFGSYQALTTDESPLHATFGTSLAVAATNPDGRLVLAVGAAPLAYNDTARNEPGYVTILELVPE